MNAKRKAKENARTLPPAQKASQGFVPNGTPNSHQTKCNGTPPF